MTQLMAMGKQMMKFSSFSLFVIAMCIFFSVSGCGTGNTTEDNKEDSPVTIETSLDPKEILKLDAENSDITRIISKYKFQYTREDYLPIYDFNDFIKDMERLVEKNTFAKALVDAAKSVNYDSFSDTEKVIFDAYIGLLFEDDMFSSDDLSVGDITEAWYAKSYTTMTDTGEQYDLYYYLLRFSGYEEKFSYMDRYAFLIFEHLGDDGVKVYKNPYTVVKKEYEQYGNCLFEKDGKMAFTTTFQGSTYVASLDVSALNDLLKSNQEFIDFMLDYRDNTYTPYMVAKIEAAAQEREEKLAEQEYWENKIPEVGMTVDEVKKTSWGLPERINKNTYSWGTTEQWSYPGKGYVYFENGIVTSISQSIKP